MQIVILAAGRGKRMEKLTEETPKPLLPYKNETLLENKLRNLPEQTTEIVLVINYLGQKIKDKLGQAFNKIPIRYVEQKEMKGTADALWQCRDILHGPFMVLMGDDLYSKTDLDKLTNIPKDKWAILTYPGDKSTKAGKIIKNTEGLFQGIYEDMEGNSNHHLLYTGACVLTPEVFSKEMIKISNGEYGLPQTFSQFVTEKEILVFETKNWIRITKPEDLQLVRA